MRRWFEKFIDCSFTLQVCGKFKEYIFKGTCYNPDTKNGLPLQYVFEQIGEPQVILNYKEARSVMGAMIDKYNK